MATGRFVELALDKHTWSPSPLAGQVVLVTSRDAAGEVNIAPKSWISMAAFAGPVLGFGCHVAHATHRNVVATAEFVVNVPSVRLADRVWTMPEAGGAGRVERSGLTFHRSRTVETPAILESAAYLECRLLQTVEFDGGEVFIFGTVTALAVNAGAAGADTADAYAAISPFFFLEDGWLAPLGPARRARGG